MRGAIFVALGAVLIWVGISMSPGGGKAEPEGPDGDARTSLASTGGPESILAPNARGGEELDDAAVAQAEEAAFRELEREEPAPPARTTVDEDAYEPPVQPTVPPVPPDEEEGAIQLGGPLGDPGEAGEVLLTAWLRQDPRYLEAYLNDGGGGELPADTRQLIVSFWQFAAGSGARAASSDFEDRSTLSDAQLALLRAAETDASERGVPDGIGRRDPLARAMRMVLLDAAAAEARSRGDHARAARCLSDLLQHELEAPWKPHREALLGWARAVDEVQVHHRLDPRGDWPAIEHEVQPNENLITIRQAILREHPGLKLCAGLLKRVNGVGKYIHPGDVLRVPTETPNVLVDLDARLALYRHGEEVVLAFEVGIGKEGHETPTGTFMVGEKQTEPSHMPQGGPRLPYGHPENPLGTRWIGWFRDGQKTSYGFHGTADPAGVGERVSKGCIRMHDTDVEVLYDLLPVGSIVRVQP